MPNEERRRRGASAPLTVAELLARQNRQVQDRDADQPTMPFGRRPAAFARTDDTSDNEVTQPISPVGPAGPARHKSARDSELYVGELLRREGRADDHDRGKSISVTKLVAAASGGVALAGTVAFGLSHLISPAAPTPLAEVKLDRAPGVVAAGSQPGTVGQVLGAPPATVPSSTSTQGANTADAKPGTPANTPAKQSTGSQQGATNPGQAAPAGSATAGTTSRASTTAPTSQSSTSQPAGTSTTAPTSSAPASSSTQQPASSASSTPTSSSTPTTTTTAPSSGLNVGILGLNVSLEPLGGFDFFSPAH